jgi:hypothetical protein
MNCFNSERNNTNDPGSDKNLIGVTLKLGDGTVLADGSTITGDMGRAMGAGNLNREDAKTYKITSAAGNVYPEGSGQGLTLVCTFTDLTTNAAFAIYEAAANSDPSSVTDNDLDGYFGDGGTNTAYYYDNGHPVEPQITNFSTTIYNATSNSLTGWGNNSTFNSNN